jgi:SsrA-binding protein
MKLIVQNRKARHEYHIVENYEAGISLKGTEVKSLREGRANMSDCYAMIHNGEVYLKGLHISPYSHASDTTVDPQRERKLLLNRSEIRKLIGLVQEKGLTLVALKLYFNDRGRVKVDLAVARGKKNYDKRHDLAEKDAKRAVERAMKYRDR